jgi:Spy/CpxP family protein refolding chaperone
MNWKHVVVSLLIGLIAGAGLGRAAHHFRPHDPRARLERFGRRLGLSPEQKAKAGEIFEANRRKLEEVRASTRAELRALLTPPQQEQFDKMEEKWRKRRGA